MSELSEVTESAWKSKMRGWDDNARKRDNGKCRI